MKLIIAGGRDYKMDLAEERRETQWLPRCVILHRGSDERLYKQIHAFQTVTEMSSARSLVFQSGEDWPSLFVNR